MAGVWIAGALLLGLAAWRAGLPPLVGFLASGFAFGAIGMEPSAMLAELAHAGVLLLLFVPLPNSPLTLCPQAQTVPWSGGALAGVTRNSMSCCGKKSLLYNSPSHPPEPTGKKNRPPL